MKTTILMSAAMMLGFLAGNAVVSRKSVHAQGFPVDAGVITGRAVGINLTTPPAQRLHIGDGNVLIVGGGETAFQFKRIFETPGFPGGSGRVSTNPIFQLGRLIAAGDGDPEFRVIYSDDLAGERAVLEFDRKGIVASVKQGRGSHFEGFACIRGASMPNEEQCVGANPNDAAPVFRLNSSPLMQLEFGPGDLAETDVAMRRVADATLGFFTGNVTAVNMNERMRIDQSGNVGIGTANPQGRLDVNGAIFQRGIQLHADYVFEKSYAPATIEDHAEYMWRHKHLRAVPKRRVDANGLEVIETGAHRTGMLEELELAHIYIEQLHKRLQALEELVSAQSRHSDQGASRPKALSTVK